MTLHQFKVATDNDGTQYVFQAIDEPDKNHGIEDDEESNPGLRPQMTNTQSGASPLTNLLSLQKLMINVVCHINLFFTVIVIYSFG